MEITTAILFPGQGSQYIGMGKSLYDNFKPVKELYEEACDSLGFNIRKISFEGPDQELLLTKNTQPAILTHSIASLTVLKQETDFLENKTLISAGHSLGEFSTLVALGVLSFHDAVKLVSLRGEFMQTACAPGVGGMSAILGLKIDEVIKICDEISTENEFVKPANFNSETQVVLSGHTKTLNIANELLAKHGARVMTLSVSAPFHSPLMKPASEKLSLALYEKHFKSLKYPYIANVDAVVYGTATNTETIIQNLVKQVYSPVMWLDTMNLLNSLCIKNAIELGPGRVLTGLLKRTNRKLKIKNIETHECLKKLGEDSGI